MLPKANPFGINADERPERPRKIFVGVVMKSRAMAIILSTVIAIAFGYGLLVVVVMVFGAR
jgi:hypothetical protein